MNKEEVLKFGISVFNYENNKFERWLKDVNISLGSVTPESLLDTQEGLKLIENCLYRIEYGNLA